MRFISFIIVLLYCYQAHAHAPECPTHKNRQDCLQSVDSRYKQMLEALAEDILEEGEDGLGELLLTAANDTRLFETQACYKTCIN